jgi:hypothetical protein
MELFTSAKIANLGLERMAYPNPLDFARIPPDVLMALDWRPYHFAIQPYHYLVRITHVVSMAAFFGGIAALDLRLLGWRRGLSLGPFIEQIVPWLYLMFGIAFVSGCGLFFYDPVHAGSHAYFMPKLILTALGVTNAALFRSSGDLATLIGNAPTAERAVVHARIFGASSLALWIGVVVCACLNVEAAPRVLLR